MIILVLGLLISMFIFSFLKYIGRVIVAVVTASATIVAIVSGVLAIYGAISDQATVRDFAVDLPLEVLEGLPEFISEGTIAFKNFNSGNY